MRVRGARADPRLSPDLFSALFDAGLRRRQCRTPSLTAILRPQRLNASEPAAGPEEGAAGVGGALERARLP